MTEFNFELSSNTIVHIAIKIDTHDSPVNYSDSDSGCIEETLHLRITGN